MTKDRQAKVFIGVDPGSTGAISVIKFRGIPTIPEIKIYKMPELASEIRDLVELLEEYNFCKFICEAVHSSPQMGVSTAFKFGRNFGVLEGVLCGRDVEYVTPQKWQAALNSRTAGDKKVSVAKAKELFPDLSGINLKTADSLLIAYYGYMKYGA